ncbi:MAG TPA: hypothetical protein VIU64_08910 [Polyangia bacterium]
MAISLWQGCVGDIHEPEGLLPSSNGGAGSGGSGGACAAGGIPADVQAFLATCTSCHGPTPLPGTPSLSTYAGLTAASAADPAQTNAERALARVQSATSPMPPDGLTPPDAAVIAALQGWIAAGYPTAACAAPGAGGTGGPDPFSVPATCTSGKTWSGGGEGSASMDPGRACISCHASTGGEAPNFAIAGTLYPTGHEPDLCDGTDGSTAGAKVVITDAQGKVITLTPNAAGNFTYRGGVTMPFQAAVTYMGRERRMASSPPNGDCNACHTANGAMSAPGRIVLP